jgi:hypothetical protein
MQSHTQTPARIRGEILDSRNTEALREYIQRTGWRRAGVELMAADRTMRAVLAGRPILHGSAVSLRMALAAAQTEKP